MDSVILYHTQNEDIKVTVEARFDNESLVIDGYDIGKRVEAYWGDSDYEYTTTVQGQHVQKLYTLMNVVVDDKQSLLHALANRFHTNTCYSEIQQWLEENKIPYEGFSWT